MHIIRLRHPWQAAWRDQPTDDAPALEPAAQQLRSVHYCRQFHRPSGLSNQQAVTLILQSIDSVSFALQSKGSHPQPTPAATHTPAPATDTKPSRAEVTCTIAIHSILLNSQPLQLSTTSDDAELITHISARVEARLEPFNQLEIVCGIAACAATDNEPTANTVQTADACSIPPPTLSQWAEVRLEIDD